MNSVGLCEGSDSAAISQPQTFFYCANSLAGHGAEKKHRGRVCGSACVCARARCVSACLLCVAERAGSGFCQGGAGPVKHGGPAASDGAMPHFCGPAAFPQNAEIWTERPPDPKAPPAPRRHHRMIHHRAAASTVGFPPDPSVFEMSMRR